MLSFNRWQSIVMLMRSDSTVVTNNVVNYRSLGMIETSKTNGLEPYAYLKTVFSKLPNITGYDDVDKLPPENCK